ncbi:MAG: hypothetical protein LBI61_01730 [Puniceicoccales bacterium]|nr:hypothetical protein [Puniceicoccales bacterium]
MSIASLSKAKSKIFKIEAEIAGEESAPEIPISIDGRTVNASAPIDVNLLKSMTKIESGSTAMVYKPKCASIGNREVASVIKKYNIRSSIFTNEVKIYEKISQRKKDFLETAEMHYKRQMAETLPVCYGQLNFTDGTTGLLLEEVAGETLENHNDRLTDPNSDAENKSLKFLRVAQIAFAAAALHEINIEHGDFHDGNLIISEDAARPGGIVRAIDVGESKDLAITPVIANSCGKTGLCDTHRFAMSAVVPTLLPNVSYSKTQSAEGSDELQQTQLLGSAMNLKNTITMLRDSFTEANFNKNPLHVANNALPEQSKYSDGELEVVKTILGASLQIDHAKLPPMLWTSKVFELLAAGVSREGIFEILEEEFPANRGNTVVASPAGDSGSAKEKEEI